MSVQLKVRTIEVKDPGAIIRGDLVSPAKPDAGEFVLRLCDKDEIKFFRPGRTYNLSAEPEFGK